MCIIKLITPLQIFQMMQVIFMHNSEEAILQKGRCTLWWTAYRAKDNMWELIWPGASPTMGGGAKARSSFTLMEIKNIPLSMAQARKIIFAVLMILKIRKRISMKCF